MSNTKKYEKLFDYLSAPETPGDAHTVLAFGRKDPLIAEKIIDLSSRGLARDVVITGGIGKDSKDLAIPESEYLAQQAEKTALYREVHLPPMFLETEATNGGENVRNSLTVMRRGHIEYGDGITAVAHATSLRRLAAMITHETVVQNDSVENVYRVPSDYSFDPTNPIDQNEAVAEMLRLADWPEKNWLQPQVDLPEDLVDFARHNK